MHKYMTKDGVMTTTGRVHLASTSSLNEYTARSDTIPVSLWHLNQCCDHQRSMEEGQIVFVSLHAGKYSHMHPKSQMEKHMCHYGQRDKQRDGQCDRTCVEHVGRYINKCEMHCVEQCAGQYTKQCDGHFVGRCVGRDVKHCFRQYVRHCDVQQVRQSDGLYVRQNVGRRVRQKWNNMPGSVRRAKISHDASGSMSGNLPNSFTKCKCISHWCTMGACAD